MNEPENNPFGPSHWELYKQLEINNFMSMCAEDPEAKKPTENQKSVDKYNLKFEKKAWADKNPKSKPSSFKTQHELFSRSMKLLFILGQFLGLNPVTGILNKDYRKMKLKLLSWKVLYCVILLLYQALGTVLALYRIFKYSISIKLLAAVTYYGSTGINTILFLFVAKKWPGMFREITNINLDEYIDPRLKGRCTTVIMVLLIFSSIEYGIKQFTNFTYILDCTPNVNNEDFYKMLTSHEYNYFFDIEYDPYTLPLAILIQGLNYLTSLNWNYANMFISCFCLYLTSIFEKINDKIESAHNMHNQWFWRNVREDYTRATRLLRLFDDVISGITFVALSNDLFYILINILNILQSKVSSGKTQVYPLDECPNYPSGIFNGEIYSIYFAFTVLIICYRFLMMSLLASRVHSAAAQPSTSLHAVPTKHYCAEMQRFVEQIHSEDVALTGLQFFKITRSLILSTAGTIVTYELVMLQLNDE